MSMYFLKIIVVSLLITLDCDIQPAFFKANPIHKYGCDRRANLLFASSCSFVSVPGWMVLMFRVRNPRQRCTFLNQRNKRNLISRSIKLNVQLTSGKTILVAAIKKHELGRSLYIKIEEVTGLSRLIQMLFYRGSLVQPHVALQVEEWSMC